MINTTANSNKEIINYYDETEYDYKLAWYSNDNPALHFGFYEKEEADSHYEALNHTNRVLAMNAGVSDGDRILDAGCGLGGSSYWLAKNFEVDVVGISLPARQIENCKERAASLELKGTTKFIQADYTKTPFKDNSFDIVWACESVCHASQKIDFYREAFRLLKPEGRLVVADYIRSNRLLSNANEKLLKNKWLNNWAIDDIDTEAENYNNLQKAGFKSINIENVNDKIRVSLRNLHEKCTRSYPLESILRFFRIRTKVQHGNLVGSIHQYQAFKKELWWYGIITANKSSDAKDTRQDQPCPYAQASKSKI